MRRNISILFVALTLFACSPAVSSEWQASWGDIHSHTSLSDGKGSPDEAYQYASAHSNFLALTEHNHQVDASEIESLVTASDNSLDGFVSIFGQEFSTINGGNHLNVYNIKDNIPASMNSNYKKLYSVWLPDYQTRHPNDIVLAQFNHPKSRHKDYGIASVRGIQNYNNDWDDFVNDANRWVKLITILNGPGSHKAGQHNIHADIQKSKVNTWFFYLEKGMRLSPTANHDTHVESWGDLTNARTGVWTDGTLTNTKLLRALKDGRCFATEDKNLSVWYTINDQPMGSELADMGPANLPVKVSISDADEPGSHYKVEIYREIVGDGDYLPKKIAEGDIEAGQVYETTVSHEDGVHEAFIVHVIQTDEMDDVDDVWTAPIYIGPGSTETEDYASIDDSVAPGGPLYVGSRRSDVYLYPSC